QPLRGQGVCSVEDLYREPVRARGGGTDRLGGVHGAAASEDGEPAEERLFGGREQVVAPRDGAAQGLLPLGQVARAASQQRQPAGEAREQRLGRQEAGAGGGQLDRQRQPVELGADLSDG